MGSSASSRAGLLHPAADPGVRRVSVPLAPGETGSSDTFPRRRTYPPKNPRRQPFRVTAVVASWPFPPEHRRASAGSIAGGPAPSRCGFRSVGFEALLRRRVWCRPAPLLTSTDPFLPGLSPLQGPSSSDGSFRAPSFRGRVRRPVRKLRLVSSVRAIRRPSQQRRQCKRGSGRSRSEIPLASESLRGSRGACTHGPSPLPVVGGFVPSSFAFAEVESGRPRCRRSLSGAEVARVGPRRSPAASRRSRRPS